MQNHQKILSQITAFISLQKILFVVILLTAIFLRFYKLGHIPYGLNRDEASLGYTAYSILHTGMEEHGVSFPINIQSFGDWKLPLYVYFLAPFITTFGLNELSIRLPSALAGVGIVYFGYVLARLLLEKEKQTKLVRAFPLIVMLSLAISPWAVHVSRIAYEANVSLFFFLLGTVLFIMASQRQLSVLTWMKTRLVWFYPLAASCFGLTLVGYHSFQVFTPLMAFVFIAVFRIEVLELWQKHRKIFFLSLIILLSFGGLLLFSNTSKANSTKYGGITIFSEKLYQEDMFQQRQIIGDVHPLLAKLYANDLSFISQKVVTNLLTLYSPDFFFIKGSNHGAHNFVGVGNFYLIEFVPVLIGLYFCVKERKPWQISALLWLAVATIAPIITIEPNHSIRFLPGLISSHLILAYGIVKMISVVDSKKGVLKLVSRGVAGVYFLWLSYLFFRFVITYFILFPTRDIDRWPWYMSELTSKVQTAANENQVIYMQGASNSPYIYFLTYFPDQYQIFENDLEYYPATDEGFVHVKRLRNIYFQETDWEQVKKSSQSAVFALEKKEIPEEIWSDKRFVVHDKITHPHSNIEWYILKYTPQL